MLVLISALRGAALRDVLREFWFLPVAIAVGAWLGTRLLIAAPPEPFLLVLAFVMLLYLNLDRLGRGHSERVQRQRAVFGIAFGFAAGVFEAIVVGMRMRDRIDAATYRGLLRKALGIMAVLLIGQFFISSS